MKRPSLSVTIFFYLFCFAIAPNALAQSQEKLYSLMLLNFARGINWPSPTTGTFVVGVLEYPPLVTELETTTAMTNINGKKIKVVGISSYDDIKDFQMVFIPAYKAKVLPKILQRIQNSPTLLVSNKTDLVRQGTGIDLVLRGGKLTFDINCNAIEQRGLKVGTNIRSIGNVVQ